MNADCANAEPKALWNARHNRIIGWQLVCPTCGIIATGRTLSEVIDTEYAHREAGEQLRTDTPVTTPVKWARLRL